MSQRFILLASVLLLTSCAYAVDKHIQDLKITTPGAQGSVCYVYVDGLRYRVYPPQSITVDNTKEDLVVDCLAPGNRRKKVIIEPQIPDSFYANAANGFVGGAFDAVSGAMYKFPAVIEVDFTDAPIVAEPPPAQNDPDIKQPEEYVLEEFLPSSPRLNSDKFATPTKIERKERFQRQESSYVDQDFSFEGSNNMRGKGNLDDAPRVYSPPIDMFPAQPAPATSDGPVKLLPEAQY